MANHRLPGSMGRSIARLMLGSAHRLVADGFGWHRCCPQVHPLPEEHTCALAAAAKESRHVISRNWRIERHCPCRSTTSQQSSRAFVSTGRSRWCSSFG